MVDASGSDVVTIPKVFHRVWFPADSTDVIPPKFEGFWTRLQELHPDYDFITHDDPDKVQGWLTNAELFQKVRDAAEADPDRYKDLAYGSLPDIVRYEICNRFGGVYIDVDFEPLNPFDDLLAKDMPFIGWESFNFVCCALMGGPPGHPAFADLVENLPAHAEEHWEEPAVGRTGPAYITSRWVERTDVLRLPPSTFYPVCWDERERLGGPYPDDTIAVHHWNAGWIPKTDQPEPEQTRTVVLIPWRGGDVDREFAWNLVKRRWAETEFEVYVADSPKRKKFNRAAAINEAAKAAGDWDVAIIADADTWDNISACRRAVAYVTKNGGACVPWNVRYKLNQHGTLRFAEMDPKKVKVPTDLDTDDPTRTSGVVPNKRGGAIVVTRECFDEVGGFDEGFTDWGHEDRAFRLAVETLTDRRLMDLSAKCYHLWHPLASTDRKGTTKGRERFERYTEAHGDREAMTLLLKELGMKKPSALTDLTVE